MSKIRTRVHLNDLDINIHMNNARYSTMFDLGRFDFLVRTGLIKTMWRKKWRPVIGSTMISYYKSLQLYEKFEVTTKVIYWDEKWFYLEHKLLRKGELIAHAYVKCLFLQYGKKIPTEKLLALFDSQNLSVPSIPSALQNWLHSEEKLKKTKFKD